MKNQFLPFFSFC